MHTNMHKYIHTHKHILLHILYNTAAVFDIAHLPTFRSAHNDMTEYRWCRAIVSENLAQGHLLSLLVHTYTHCLHMHTYNCI